MARTRRRKPGGLIAEAATSDWKFGAALSCMGLLVALVAPFLFPQHPVLAAAGPVISFAALFFALVFAIIALMRFLRQRSNLPTARAQSTIKPASAGGVRKAGDTQVVLPQVNKPLAWSFDVIDRVEWKRFEDLCCAYFREKGIRADTTRLGADGGIDIHLFQDDNDPARMTSIVQCKAWSHSVGVKPVRELRGVMAHEKVEKAFFMAPNGFTEDAKVFANENRISLLDGRAFLMMIERLPEDARQRLLDLATSGDWTTPTCPACGDRMTARSGGRGSFWGCTTYPRCDAKLPMRAARSRQFAASADPQSEAVGSDFPAPT